MTHAEPTSPDRGRWLVVAAWQPELDQLRSVLPASLRRCLHIATVGVGLVEAAGTTARLIARLQPAGLVLVGTAGVYPGHARAFPLGTAAVVGTARLLPAGGADRSAYWPAAMPSRVSATPALVAALRRGAGLHAAAVACPLAITSGRSAARTAARQSGCALENLETFAVARAAAAKLPFAAILGIANHVGPQGHREWRRHARAAAAAACDAAVVLLRVVAKAKPR